MGILEILIFLLVLTALIFFHELGHYWVARRCGVRVETFSIGFGREIFGWTDRHGTRWKIGFLPLGGYVKMFGAHETPEFHTKKMMTAEEKKVAFDFKPLWQRVCIVAAGPIANFLLAIILFAVVLGLSGQRVPAPVLGQGSTDSFVHMADLQSQDEVIAINDHKIKTFDDLIDNLKKYEGETVPLVFKRNGNEKHTTVEILKKSDQPRDYYNFSFFWSVGVVQPGDPADQAGLKNGDVILALNGQKIINFDAIQARLYEYPNDPLTFTIQRGDNTQDIIIQPKQIEKMGREIGYIGIGPKVETTDLSYNPINALIQGVDQTVQWTSKIIDNIGGLLSGKHSVNEMAGVIGIAQIIGESAKQGFFAVLSFMAVISINLGLINLLPIPVLDGGHLAFYAAEALLRKPLSEKTKNALMIVGLMFILGLFLLTTVVDLKRIL